MSYHFLFIHFLPFFLNPPQSPFTKGGSNTHQPLEKGDAIPAPFYARGKR